MYVPLENPPPSPVCEISQRPNARNNESRRDVTPIKIIFPPCLIHPACSAWRSTSTIKSPDANLRARLRRRMQYYQVVSFEPVVAIATQRPARPPILPDPLLPARALLSVPRVLVSS